MKAVAIARAVQPESLVVGSASWEELIRYWPFVLEGLRKVRADLEGHSFWEPEHIRAALEASFLAAKRGEVPGTELWLCRDPEGGGVAAFAVTQVMVDPFLHVPLCLFVWVMYKDPAYTGDAVGATVAQLEAAARVRGYRWLEAMTIIPAFAKHLERHGWRHTLSVMRRDLWLYEDSAPTRH